MRGECSRCVRGGERERGGRQGNPEDHGLPIGYIRMAHRIGPRALRDQRKASAKERVGGIGDLDLRRLIVERVIERGRKMIAPLIILITPS